LEIVPSPKGEMDAASQKYTRVGGIKSWLKKKQNALGPKGVHYFAARGGGGNLTFGKST